MISQSWTCSSFRSPQVIPPKFTPITETVDQEIVAFWWLWSGNVNIWGLQQHRGALKHLCVHLSCVCVDPHILERLQRSRGQYAQLRLFSSANFEVQSPCTHIHTSLFKHQFQAYLHLQSSNHKLLLLGVSPPLQPLITKQYQPFGRLTNFIIICNKLPTFWGGKLSFNTNHDPSWWIHKSH